MKKKKFEDCTSLVITIVILALIVLAIIGVIIAFALPAPVIK